MLWFEWPELDAIVTASEKLHKRRKAPRPSVRCPPIKSREHESSRRHRGGCKTRVRLPFWRKSAEMFPGLTLPGEDTIWRYEIDLNTGGDVSKHGMDNDQSSVPTTNIDLWVTFFLSLPKKAVPQVRPCRAEHVSPPRKIENS